jgi:hypothetical protein
MTRVTRPVEQAYDAAKGRAVAHLDSEAVADLGIEPGDAIAIEGDERTVVTVARQRDTDPSDAVRIDGFTRNNAGVQPHESVDIEPVGTEAADSVTVRPPKPLCCPIGSDHAPFVTNELLGTPTMPGERLWVMVGPQQPFGVVVGSWRPLDVIATAPDGPVVVTKSTDITVESAIDDVDTGGAADGTESWDALRESVFERDGRACRNCGVDFDTGSATLEAHFIVTPHHGGTVDADNVVTLCRQCHVTAHQHVTTPSV